MSIPEQVIYYFLRIDRFWHYCCAQFIEFLGEGLPTGHRLCRPCAYTKSPFDSGVTCLEIAA